jgi:hypothetical protein
MDSSTAELVLLLEHAASQNPTDIKMAEEKLKGLETQKGFYHALTLIVATHNLSTPIRWQAVIYVKNGIDRYWRKMAPNAVCEEEKAAIRTALLCCLGEPVQQIALQVAVVIGKAARYDVPREWPELIPALVNAIQHSGNDDLVQHRSLLVMHHTVKALSSKRLAADRRVFHEMVQQMTPFVLRIWHAHHENTVARATGVQSGGGEAAGLVLPLEKATIALKVLRKSIVHGMREPHKNQDVMVFLNTLLQHTRTLLELRRSLPAVREAFEKYLVLHLKILSDLLESHPFSFLPILRPTLELVCSLCFGPTSASDGLLFQRFTIFCLNLVKQVLLCMEYRTPKNLDDVKDSRVLEGSNVKREFFTDAIVSEVCVRLITDYLPLSRDELTQWDADPEEYMMDDSGDSWKYSYRPCCETAFLAVFHEHRALLSKHLVELARQNSTPVPTHDLEAILNKDAVYNAVGLAAFDLYEEIDFDQWLVGLEAELAVKDSNYRIVRRRAAWLLGQWSGIKLSPELRPRLYQILLPLLDPTEDMVVRLVAAKALKVVIDDFEFSSAELEPYLADAFGRLFTLLKEVKECDTKLCVLNVLSYLIERMGTSIRPFFSDLLQYLPALWDASEEHNMLRCLILSTLVFIVQGLGTLCANLAPFLLPLIHMSTDLTSPQSVYLLEDGLELWLTVLHNTKEMGNELFQLAMNIGPLLELGSEHMTTMAYILQAYILISPHAYITTYGESVCGVFQSQYPDLLDEGILLILRIVDLAVLVGPPQVTQIFRPLLLCSVRAVCEGDNYPMLMTLHLSIVSRLILAYPNQFSEMTVVLAQEMDKEQGHVAARLLDVWFDKMPCVTQPEKKKLLSLALCSMLGSGAAVVYEGNRIYSILVNVVETLNDVTNVDNETGNYVDTLLATEIDLAAEADDLAFETEHDSRKRKGWAQDPIRTIALREFFQAHLVRLQGQLGSTKYTEVMANVDVETMENMKVFVAVS